MSSSVPSFHSSVSDSLLSPTLPSSFYFFQIADSTPVSHSSTHFPLWSLSHAFLGRSLTSFKYTFQKANCTRVGGGRAEEIQRSGDRTSPDCCVTLGMFIFFASVCPMPSSTNCCCWSSWKDLRDPRKLTSHSSRLKNSFPRTCLCSSSSY